MRWLSTAARTRAPNRVHSSAATRRSVITRATPTRNSRYTPKLTPRTVTAPRRYGGIWIGCSTVPKMYAAPATEMNASPMVSRT